MELKPRLSSDGRLTETERGWLLSIPAGNARHYRLSQLDDHAHLARRNYPRRPPFKLELEARVSAASPPGTWGFGVWNDPYGFSFGPGDGFLRLPSLPNAAWFFYSSPKCYLSFRDDKPANGLVAQVFVSPRLDSRLLPAAAAFPFSLKTTRRWLSRIIREDSVRLSPTAAASDSTAAPIDSTDWHSFGLEWTSGGTCFTLDERAVLNTPLSPRSPLGIVIWIDNQHAALTPQGGLSFGMESNTDPTWLEIRDLRIS